MTRLTPLLVASATCAASICAAPARADSPAPAAAAAPAAPASPAKPSRKQVLVPGAGPSPLSAVVRAGDLIFVSGQLGFPQGTRELVPGGIGPETKAALEGVAANLAKVQLGMEDVVKCTVFLADMADFAAMNAAYATFFPKEPPARSTVAVAGLVLKARVEIECIAVTR